MKNFTQYLEKIITLIYLKIIFPISRVKHKSNLRVRGLMRIRNNGDYGSINIGKNVSIRSGYIFNSLSNGSFSSLNVLKKGAKIIIGDNVGISDVLIVCREKIEICKNTHIGVNTKIMDSDFHNVIDYKSNNINSKPVFIGENCFIGCDCIILKGVSIGKNSVIAAGSLVNKSFPEGSLIAGIPAINKN